jgi:hypothetical protein
VRPAPRPSSLRPALAPAWDAVVGRCLERDQARRFGSAGEMLAELERRLVAKPRRVRRITLGVAGAVSALAVWGLSQGQALRARPTVQAGAGHRRAPGAERPRAAIGAPPGDDAAVAVVAAGSAVAPPAAAAAAGGAGVARDRPPAVAKGRARRAPAAAGLGAVEAAAPPAGPFGDGEDDAIDPFAPAAMAPSSPGR